MSKSNSNEWPVDILANFEEASATQPESQPEQASSPPPDIQPEPQAQDTGFMKAVESTWPDTIEDEVIIPPVQKKKQPPHRYLNKSDTIKMRFIVSLQVFLFFGILYYFVVLLTVSWSEVLMLWLTTERFSQIHFMLYIVFVFTVARVFVRTFEYLGDRFFNTDALGIAANTLSILWLILLYLDHFNLGNILKDLLSLLPF